MFLNKLLFYKTLEKSFQKLFSKTISKQSLRPCLVIVFKNGFLFLSKKTLHIKVIFETYLKTYKIN